MAQTVKKVLTDSKGCVDNHYMNNTTCPTDIRYFANHDSDTLRRIVKTKTDESLTMFLNGGEMVAKDALAIANNAWGEDDVAPDKRKRAYDLGHG